MKLLILTLATIIASSCADVVHLNNLNNQYLPPDQVDVIPLPNNQISLELPAQQAAASVVVSQQALVLPQVEVKTASDPVPEPAPELAIEAASEPAPEQAAPAAPEAAASLIVSQQSVVQPQVEVKAVPVAAVINTRIAADEESEASQINIVQNAQQPLILQSAPVQQELLLQPASLQLNIQQAAVPQQLSVQQAVAQLDQVIVEQQQQQQLGSGIDTQYAADGGYIY